MSKKTLVYGLVALAVSCSTMAIAANSPSSRGGLSGGELFEYHGCVNCHGNNGVNPVTQKVPKIGGKEEEFIYTEANKILSGERATDEAKLMHSALSYHSSCDTPPTDGEIKKIAAWLAKQ